MTYNESLIALLDSAKVPKGAQEFRLVIGVDSLEFVSWASYSWFQMITILRNNRLDGLRRVEYRVAYEKEWKIL